MERLYGKLKGEDMYKILNKQTLSTTVKRMSILAPLVANKAEPGHFIILRINESGERIPLTVVDYNNEAGTVDIIFQEVGKTTKLLGTLNVGDSLLDFAGPLGNSSHLGGVKKVLAIGGGVGVAPLYPQIKKLHNNGVEVDVIIGARNSELVILDEELRDKCSNLYIMTDDGSKGEKGLVTDKARELLDTNDYDMCITIGPVIMMKFVSILTREYNLRTTVSLNPIMIDGTGMCGGCRVKIGDDIKFACVDGPEFDGHLVDYDGLMRRQGMYKDMEKTALDHTCKLG